MNNQKAAVSQAEGEKFKRKLAELLRKTENSRCVDCGAPKPNWASANLGVFICLTCSGIHRSLGVHISQVRSTSLDTWTRQQMQFIQCMDNVKANSYWEAKLLPSYTRPSPSNRIELENFIRAKYERRKFVGSGDAPTLSNFATHPWFQKQDLEQTNSPVSLSKPVSSPTSTQPQPQKHAPAQASVSFDLLSMEEPTSTPSPATPQQVTPSDPFGDFVLPNPEQASPPPVPAPSAMDQLQDPFQASSNVSLTTPETHHQKSTSAPNDIDQLDGFGFGQFASSEAVPTTFTTTNNVTTQNGNGNGTKLSADDIMSLYDKQQGGAAVSNNGGIDDNFFVDPNYVKRQQQQQQMLQHQQAGMGIHHAASAPNLTGQGYQQQMWMQQQQQQLLQQQQQQYGMGMGMGMGVGVSQQMNYQSQFNMMGQGGGISTPQNGTQFQQQQFF